MSGIDNQKLFSEYIAKHIIYIVDLNAASRSRVMRSLIDLGAKSTSIKTFKQYGQAISDLKKDRPKIIFSEYKLGNKSAFDLLNEYKEIHDAEKDSLFILITANSSQSLVAQAAEEDIDAFVLKPYTLEIFRKVFMDATLAKINPSEYIQTIEKGKILLFNAKPKEAMEVFLKATSLHPKPALAYFYYGQAEKMQELLGDAEEKFKTGLTFNTIHYKCLTALFDLLLDEKKFEEAYDVVKVIVNYFPANPKRLTSVIRLAVTTNHFEDIENLYQIFVDLENRNDELINYICAGLIICGKYYLMNRNEEKALNIYLNLKNSLYGKNQYLLYIIENLVLFNLTEHSQDFFKRFPPDSYQSQEYLIAEFLTQESTINDEEVIQKGKALLEKNIHNHCIYYVMIKRFLKMKKSEDANFYKKEALHHFPYKKKQFTNIKSQ